MDDSFINDMEQGGYAPECSHSIKRLNAVVRKYEEMLNLPDEEGESTEEESEEESESEDDDQ